jgi:hypothetical protein
MQNDVQAAVDVRHHLLLAYGLAVSAMRSGSSIPARVGLALNLFPCLRLMRFLMPVNSSKPMNA